MRRLCSQWVAPFVDRWVLVFALAPAAIWQVCAPASVCAHGPAPSVLSVVAEDGSGPTFLRLSGGFARREGPARFRFVCPAAWGDDLVPPAAKLPGGEVVVAGARGIYVVDAAGMAAPHPDSAASMPVTDFAQLGGKLYALRTTGGNAEVVEVGAARVRSIFSEEGRWTSIAATAEALGLQRLTADHVEQLRITAEGQELGRERAPSPKDPILIIARATAQQFYSVIATTTGRELGQIQPDLWMRLETAVSSIAGPVDVPEGEPFIAVDTSLMRLPELGVALDGMAPVSCLGRVAEMAYACTREGVVSLAPSGLGEPIFALSSMLPPDLTLVPELQRDLCESQWEHFRFDLLALGVDLMDAPVTGAGGAGMITSTGGSDAAPRSAGGAGAAGSGRKPPSHSQGGCSAGGAGASRAGALCVLALFAAFVLGVRSRSRCYRVLPFVAACLLMFAGACDREAEGRAEARGLLERLNKLSANGSLTERNQALAALAQFAVRDPKHAITRDVCHAAHKQLLQAEAAQVSARKALDEATSGVQPGGVGLAPERGRAIAAELESSNEALAAAKRDFPKCEQATVELTQEAR